MKRWFSILSLLILAPSTAFACGEWSLMDHRLGEEQRFRVGGIMGLFGVVGHDPVRLQAYEGDERIGFFRNCHLHWRGRRVGCLEGEQLRIRDTTYRIEISSREDPHGIYLWMVKVHQGDELVAEGNAMSFCACGGCTESHKQDDIRRRVAFYLAKRDLG